jgi:hypothetical protein
MKNDFLRACAIATICSGAALAAQTPTTGQSPAPAQPTAATSQQPTTTLSGCVYKEQDVPGRAPNVAERAGVLEDYILAVMPRESGAAPTAGTSGAAGTSGTSGTAGTSGTMNARSMYKLEHIEDQKLSAVVGKRVEVTGRIDAEAGDKAVTPATPPTTSTDRAIGRDRIDLPEFEVTAIREVAGTCPAKPAAK